MGIIPFRFQSLVDGCNEQVITPNNRINSDWQFRCTPLPAGYAGR